MTDNDPFLWLEDIDGPRALAWVREQNARSLALLESDPRYSAFLAEARAIITAADRIPYPSFLGDDLVNFWQDEAHVRGLWRRTTLDSFRAAEPHWETLLDIDALAAAEGRNWVFHGVVSLPPEYRRCLVCIVRRRQGCLGIARIRSRVAALCRERLSCRKASRAPSGSTTTRCSSRATGAPAR